MIPVEEALRRVLDLARPVGDERVGLRSAAGRVLRAAATARLDQPPFDASAMDGYAVRGDPGPGARFSLIGASRAGLGFAGTVGPGEAVRIFTGAPMPEGADRVIIQEDADPDATGFVLRENADRGRHVRPRGGDFAVGDVVDAPRRLRPADLALLAAMDVPEVTVARRPDVVILSTGDELVMPGEARGADQIVASNLFAIAAMAEAEGASVRILPIAPDDPERLGALFARTRGTDLVVSIGGASVGEHDLVAASATAARGFVPAFWKIAMRPGKPLMAGRLEDGAMMLGLPGNPVSAIVCTILFLLPLVRAMQGLADPAPRLHAGRLARGVEANGPRAHYMRARILPPGSDGLPRIEPFADQDSARLRVLSAADALLVRPAHAPASEAGSDAVFLPL
jgi:molybdopterin molybdotransferase